LHDVRTFLLFALASWARLHAVEDDYSIMATLHETLTSLTQATRAAEAALDSARADAEGRAEKLADALRSFPNRRLYACLLEHNGRPAVAVVDQEGKLQPGLGDKIREPLTRKLEGAEGGSLTGAGEVAGADPIVTGLIRHRDHNYGVLAVSTPVAEEADTAALLESVGQHIGLALHLEEEQGGPEEVERREWLGYVSETTSIVAHEFNNFLNGIMLHLALLKQEAPKQMTPELDVMKRLATDAANLIKRLQQYNSRHRLPLGSIDLNQAIEDTLARVPLPPGVVRVDRNLAPDLPRVQGTHHDIGRLLSLLLKQAGAAMAGKPGCINIRTELANRKVVLRFEDAGPCVDAAALPRLFEPFFLGRPGVEEPGLALCHTLARRLHAGLRAENRPEGGVGFILDFAPSA
jgi:signal transduction histidine kinase